MTRDATTPLPASRRLALALLPVGIAAGLVVLSFAAQLAVRWNFPLPQCLFRKLTGLPCLSCGCTRSLTAWSQLDVATAFYFNPLFFLLCLGLFAWLVVSMVEHFSGQRLMVAARARLRRWPVWRVVIALVLANWVYLCLALPRGP